MKEGRKNSNHGVNLKHTRLLFALLLLFILNHCASLVSAADEVYYEDDVFVKDLKLYVGGQEFFIKAMAYSPVPLGITNMTKEGFQGAGYCSPKKTVFSEYKSGCFGSDYFDGTTDYTRWPPGPLFDDGKLKPWWYDIWQRDFKNMKDMGVNTIRIYNINMITKTFLSMYPNEYQVTDRNVAADHIPFLDAAHAAGLKVIVPIVTDEKFLLESSNDRITKHIEAQVTEMGDHPALLMWCLGNEMDIYTNTNLLNIVNNKIALVRQRTMAIHNRRIPVTHAIIDYPDKYEPLVKVLDVDIFTTNAGYRDVDMDPLWNGENYKLPNGTIYPFVGWKTLSQQYNKPLFVGEMGMHQSGSQVTDARPDWFNQQYRAVLRHVDDGCVGACFFEYLDEVNKPDLQKTMGVFAPKVNIVNGKSSMVMHDFVPDLLEPKNHIYKAITEGETGANKQYNMRANVFTLINRQPTSVPVVPRPKPNPSPKPSTPAPGTSTPAPVHSQPRPDPSSSTNARQSSNNAPMVAISFLVLAISALVVALVF